MSPAMVSIEAVCESTADVMAHKVAAHAIAKSMSLDDVRINADTTTDRELIPFSLGS
jgi:hypothetical protein